jgi:hypothetical protein
MSPTRSPNVIPLQGCPPGLQGGNHHRAQPYAAVMAVSCAEGMWMIAHRSRRCVIFATLQNCF